MSNNNMNLFKDEILNKIREIESKFLNELSKKNLEININYENFSEKVNSILESNRLMIESITNQKIHFEKISKLELITKKLDDKLITQEIRITNLFNDIKQMKANYDKIITDNLIIPGYLGPGCPFRSLGNFIISSTDEFKKFKDEKEFIKKMNLELKDKLDSMFKNMSNFVEFNSSNCRAYTDSKEREYNIKLDSKFRQMNEKTIETNRHIYSKQINFEEKLKEIGNEIDKLYENKKNENNLINGKFEEIKVKEEEMKINLIKTQKEIYELQLTKKELIDQIKNLYSKIENLNKITKLKIKEKNVINSDILYSNEKNLNKYENNSYYNTNNISEYTKKASNYNKKNDFSNKISRTNNQFPISNLNQIFNTETKTTNLNLNSTEEQKEISNNKEKKLYENNLGRNLTNNKKKNIDNYENNINTPIIKTSNEDNKKSSSFIKIKIKEDKKKLINSEIKPELKALDYIDEQNNINTESKNKNNKKIIFSNYENNYFGKTNIDHYIKSEKKINYKTIIKPYLSSDLNKDYQNTLRPQKNLINNLSLTKKELLAKLQNENDVDIFKSKNIQTSNGNISHIDCNLINLNLLDLPNNKKNIIENSNNNKIQKYSDLKKQIKKKSFKSLDLNSNNKIYPYFGKTTKSFYNNTNNGQIKENFFNNSGNCNIDIK